MLAGSIAEHLNLDVARVKNNLNDLVRKGQIKAKTYSTSDRYFSINGLPPEAWMCRRWGEYHTLLKRDGWWYARDAAESQLCRYMAQAKLLDSRIITKKKEYRSCSSP